jgi:hypothetical protein
MNCPFVQLSLSRDAAPKSCRKVPEDPDRRLLGSHATEYFVVATSLFMDPAECRLHLS